MLFPDSARVVYRENPLEQVICQLRFPPILEISSSEPARFQSALRQQYPLYEKESGGIDLPAGIQLPPQIANAVKHFGVQVEGAETHKFMDAESIQIISLTRDFLAVNDKAYERWEQFRPMLESAKSALEEFYAPAFYLRVGLRYQNVIDKKRLGLEREQWSSLLSESLLGALLVSPDFRDQVRRFQTVAVIAFDDVQGGLVTLRHGFVDPEGEDQAQTYRIDADFYTEEKEATQDAMATVDRFHRLAGRLFRWAITPRLHEALQPTEPD